MSNPWMFSNAPAGTPVLALISAVHCSIAALQARFALATRVSTEANPKPGKEG